MKEAEDELAIVMEQLSVAKATLQEVNDRLASLEKAFNEAVEKKDMLEKKCVTFLSFIFPNGLSNRNLIVGRRAARYS